MIDTIISIINIALTIIILIAGFKYTKIKKKLRRKHRECYHCGYSRDDIEDAWQIYEPDNIIHADNAFIKCQKCERVQLEWEKKK